MRLKSDQNIEKINVLCLYNFFYFTDNAVDTKKPPTPFVAINTGEKSPQSRRSRNLSSPNVQQQDLPTATSNTATTIANTMVSNTTEPEKVTLDVKRKSLLNASYSSEEILLQAASSLQGLEGKNIIMIIFTYLFIFSLFTEKKGCVPKSGTRYSIYKSETKIFVKLIYSCISQNNRGRYRNKSCSRSFLPL